MRKALVGNLQRVSLPALGKSIYYWSLSQTAAWKQVQGFVPHVSPYNDKKFDTIWLSA